MANRFKAAAEKREENSARAEAGQAKPKPKTEGPKDVAISIKLPSSMRDDLRMHYATTGETMSAYIRRLIEQDQGK